MSDQPIPHMHLADVEVLDENGEWTGEFKPVTIIDTPEGLAHFRLCQVIAALRIETKTGLKHSQGSILKLAQQRYGATARTKRGALAQLETLYFETYGTHYGR
jgi:hypothetical protein